MDFRCAAAVYRFIFFKIEEEHRNHAVEYVILRTLQSDKAEMFC